MRRRGTFKYQGKEFVTDIGFLNLNLYLLSMQFALVSIYAVSNAIK